MTIVRGIDDDVIEIVFMTVPMVGSSFYSYQKYKTIDHFKAGKYKIVENSSENHHKSRFFEMNYIFGDNFTPVEFFNFQFSFVK